jgi:hypothetical protein
MARKKRENWRDRKNWFKHNKEDRMKYRRHGCGIYFLGFVGAAVYYIQSSTTFWQGVVGLLKALFWPAFLVYQLLGGH